MDNESNNIKSIFEGIINGFVMGIIIALILAFFLYKMANLPTEAHINIYNFLVRQEKILKILKISTIIIYLIAIIGSAIIILTCKLKDIIKNKKKINVISKKK